MAPSGIRKTSRAVYLYVTSTVHWLLRVTFFDYILAIVGVWVDMYSRFMQHTPKAGVMVQKSKLVHASFIWNKFKKRNAMKLITYVIFAIITMGTLAAAKELPNAPEPMTPYSSSVQTIQTPAAAFTTTRFETHVVDKKFLALAVISTGATLADSYTTLFARENWLAHKQGVCNEEVESAYLYGTHPTVARTYAVGAAKSAGALFAAYYLRKHHSKLWSLPLIANTVIGSQGVTQNMINCN
jgi:hypothetical protein